jgi:hypothetical protein
MTYLGDGPHTGLRPAAVVCSRGSRRLALSRWKRRPSPYGRPFCRGGTRKEKGGLEIWPKER